MKIKFEWEEIRDRKYDTTERAKVIGGWLVKSVTQSSEEAMSESMVFVSDPKHECLCTHQQMVNYRSRISGPLLDRIDIHVEVPAVSYRALTQKANAEPSISIQKRVAAALGIQSKRFEGTKIYCNANMSGRHIKKHCRINTSSAALLESALDKLGLSARAYNRILKIARTISDLAGSDLAGDAGIQTRHVSEAIQYRTSNWGRL